MLYLYHVNTFAYFELKDQLLIGRTTGQLVYGDDGKMSGKHAQIVAQETNGQMVVTIEDLGSKNLSAVNRTQIPSLQKIRIKPMSLIEVGSQQFILTETNSMSLETLNQVMDQYLTKAMVKQGKEKTSSNVKIVFEDPLLIKEKELAEAEKELAVTDQLIRNSQLKRQELIKSMTALKRDIDQAKALKTEMENKKKKIINLKDIAD